MEVPNIAAMATTSITQEMVSAQAFQGRGNLAPQNWSLAIRGRGEVLQSSRYPSAHTFSIGKCLQEGYLPTGGQLQ